MDNLRTLRILPIILRVPKFEFKNSKGKIEIISRTNHVFAYPLNITHTSSIIPPCSSIYAVKIVIKISIRKNPFIVWFTIKVQVVLGLKAKSYGKYITVYKSIIIFKISKNIKVASLG